MDLRRRVEVLEVVEAGTHHTCHLERDLLASSARHGGDTVASTRSDLGDAEVGLDTWCVLVGGVLGSGAVQHSEVDITSAREGVG